MIILCPANEKRLSSGGYAGRPDMHLRDALRGPRRDIFSQARAVAGCGFLIVPPRRQSGENCVPSATG